MPRKSRTRGKRSGKQPPSELKLQRRRKDKIQKSARTWKREWKYDQQEFPQVISPLKRELNQSGELEVYRDPEELDTALVVYKDFMSISNFRWLDLSGPDCDILNCNVIPFLPLFSMREREFCSGYSKCCDSCNACYSETCTLGWDIGGEDKRRKFKEMRGEKDWMVIAHYNKFREWTLRRQRIGGCVNPIQGYYTWNRSGYVALQGDMLVFVLNKAEYDYDDYYDDWNDYEDEDEDMQAFRKERQKEKAEKRKHEQFDYEPCTMENLEKILTASWDIHSWVMVGCKNASEFKRKLLWDGVERPGAKKVIKPKKFTIKSSGTSTAQCQSSATVTQLMQLDEAVVAEDEWIVVGPSPWTMWAEQLRMKAQEEGVKGIGRLKRRSKKIHVYMLTGFPVGVPLWLR